MFEGIGKPNLTNLLVLGAIGLVVPRLLPQMAPAMGTAVKIVVDLLTESEAEAAEELVEALVSGTMAEINRHIAGAEDPGEGRRSVERSIAQFKHKARQRAHRWGRDDKDRHRRYRRHLTRLREEVERARPSRVGWQRDIFDDLGEAIEEEVV
jgi:Sec-independent protein translocase protein TatA